MWADYARGVFFSAGNTTTNRIEANWNQLKLLLDHRPRLDRTMAGVLSHHVAVVRQFMSVLRRHSSRARPAGTVPKFLRSMSGRLADNIFRLVKKQWDLLHSAGAQTFITPTANESEWEVSISTRPYVCNSEVWQCTCHFNISLQLPCRHLMVLARDQLGLEALPDNAIPQRWCMRAAESMYDVVDAGVPLVLDAVDVVKLKAKLKAPESTSAPLSGSAEEQKPQTSQSKRRVVYTRLHRHQKAKMIVLSPEEKYRYAYAAVAPLLDRLSNSSTPEFYSKLEHLEGVVQQLLERVDEINALKMRRPMNGESSDTEDNLDALDVMEMINTLDETDCTNEERRYLTYESASQVSLPELAISDASQRIISGDTGDDDANVGVDNGAVSEIDGMVNETPSVRSTPAASGVRQHSELSVTATTQLISDDATQRGVHVMRLPKGNVKKKLGRPKKTTQRRRPTGSILAVQEWPTITVSLPDLLVWMLRHPNIRLVKEVMTEYPIVMADPFLEGREPKCRRERVNPDHYVYNFVVPRSLVDTMNRVLLEERKHDSRAARALRRASRTDRVSDAATCDEASDKEGSEGEIVVSYGANFKSFTR
jgi:hypothetical protein